MTPTKRKTQTKIRIIKKVSDCPKVSPTTRGSLKYEVGVNDEDQSLHIRCTANDGGGFFSKQWISLDDIENAIGAQDNAFKATVFRPLYTSSSGANNHGFLAAALRAEGILDEAEHPLSPIIGDIKKFKTEMAKLIKAKTDLHDTRINLKQRNLAARFPSKRSL